MTMLPEQIDTFSKSAASKNSFDKMFCCDHTYPVLLSPDCIQENSTNVQERGRKYGNAKWCRFLESQSAIAKIVWYGVLKRGWLSFVAYVH